MEHLIDILQGIYEKISPLITADNVALFSVLVTILIFILNRHSELKYKKQADCKTEYIKLIELLCIVHTEPDKLSKNKNGKIDPKVQKQFFDTGASLMLYASKRLYKQYVFFRDFSTSEHMKLSKYYDSSLIMYIIADILKQIRKEVGLTYWNSITENEAIAFFVNDIGTNPVQAINSYEKIYRIKMLKIEMFFMNRFRLVTLHKIYYYLVKPIFGILRCALMYIIFLPVAHIFKKLFGNKKEKIESN